MKPGRGHGVPCSATSALRVFLLASVLPTPTGRTLSRFATQLTQLRGAGRQAPAWDYRDHGNNWYTFNAVCSGPRQSPINISEATKVQGEEKLFYRFVASEKPVPMRNDGRALVASVEGLEHGTIATGKYYPTQIDKSYRLRRILVHTPSEHSFQGKRVPLELQLVHEGGVGPEAIGGEIAIVSVGFTVISAQSTSRFLDALRQGGLPNATGAETVVNREPPALMDFSEIFGPQLGQAGVEQANFWQYSGSLTAPPCSTGVQWFVRDDALPASPNAIVDFQQAIMAVASVVQDHPGNDREFQLLGERTVALRPAHDAIEANNPPKENQTFAKTMDSAEEAQRLAQAAISGVMVADAGQRITDEANELHYHGYSAPAGVQDASAVAEAARGVQPGNDVEVCLQTLATVYEELAACETRQKAECDAALAAEQAFLAANTTGNPAATVQAAATRDTQQSLCTGETQTLDSLKAQAETQQAECDRLKTEAEAAAASASAAS